MTLVNMNQKCAYKNFLSFQVFSPPCFPITLVHSSTKCNWLIIFLSDYQVENVPLRILQLFSTFLPPNQVPWTACFARKKWVSFLLINIQIIFNIICIEKIDRKNVLYIKLVSRCQIMPPSPPAHMLACCADCD